MSGSTKIPLFFGKLPLVFVFPIKGSRQKIVFLSKKHKMNASYYALFDLQKVKNVILTHLNIDEMIIFLKIHEKCQKDCSYRLCK